MATTYQQALEDRLAVQHNKLLADASIHRIHIRGVRPIGVMNGSER
jgi:hypothetical protein